MSTYELDSARIALSETIIIRLENFQHVTHCPLVGKRRTPAQLARLLDQAEELGSESQPWQALGMAHSPLLDHAHTALASLPDLLRKDVWGPLDVLLALAGHLTPQQQQGPGLASDTLSGDDIMGQDSSDVQNITQVAGQIASSGADGSPVMIDNIISGRPDTFKLDSALRSTVNPLQYPDLLKNQGGAAINSYGLPGGVLPRSLSDVSTPVALDKVPAAGTEWLRSFMNDLRPHARQVGIDDRVVPWYRDLKLQAAAALLQEGHTPALCRGFARCGVPQGARPGVWQAALGLPPGPPSQAEIIEFESLVHTACCQPLLADAWLLADAASVADSPHFFLFEETIRATLLAFLRDETIITNCATPSVPTYQVQDSTSQAAGLTNMMQSDGQAHDVAESRQNFDSPKTSNNNVHTSQAGRDASSPAAGHTHVSSGRHKKMHGRLILPQGTALLLGPVCFLYDDPAAVYRVHRAMYCRYWCKLHSLSHADLPSPTLPCLLKTFQELLKELDGAVFSHLIQLGVPPVAVALPWMWRAFVGYLPVEEVLLLWDRIIGLDSLLPLALMATAIMCFRRQVLLSCSSAREVLDAMSDISQMQTVPLLQAVLFQG